VTEKKSKLHVKIPTPIVRNDGIFVSNKDFVLYARLCFQYFRNYHEKEIVIDHKKLMRNCKIADTRTFKKMLKRLYDNKLILNEIEKLPTKGTLTIVFNPEIYKDDHFTMLSSEILTYFNNDQIDEYAFRLIFYYKSHINKKDKRSVDYCFVGYDTLIERLRVSKTSITEGNKQLDAAKLVKIEAHKLKHNYEYDENDELVFDRFNNHYFVANSLF